MSAASRRRCGGDAGMSVVEIAIVAALASVASVAITGLLVSQANAERHVSRFTVNQEEVRQALVQVQRDLRSAEPLIAVGSKSQLRYQLDLSLYPSIGAPAAVHVRWRLGTGTDAGTLLREQVDSNGTATVTYRLRGVENANLGVPVFRYYRADGVEYDVVGDTTVTAGDVAYCTVHVGIDLRASPEGGEAVHLQSEVQLRNKLPGADACPEAAP